MSARKMIGANARARTSSSGLVPKKPGRQFTRRGTADIRAAAARFLDKHCATKRQNKEGA